MINYHWSGHLWCMFFLDMLEKSWSACNNAFFNPPNFLSWKFSIKVKCHHKVFVLTLADAFPSISRDYKLRD